MERIKEAAGKIFIVVFVLILIASPLLQITNAMSNRPAKQYRCVMCEEFYKESDFEIYGLCYHCTDNVMDYCDHCYGMFPKDSLGRQYDENWCGHCLDLYVEESGYWYEVSRAFR